MEKPATTAAPIHELLSKRWSPRAFNPAREITPAEMTALAEAARWAPSSYGAQPWSYIFCPRHAQVQAWEKAFAALAEPNQAWVQNTSLLICAITQLHFPHNDKPNRHHQYDTGAASVSIALQAEALGLRAHQMSGFDPEVIKTNFAVPDGFDPIAMIAVGEQASADKLPAGQVRDMEEAPASRDELGTRFFLGAWGSGLS